MAASYAKTGAASRALALDLVLRTFMNSTDFNVSNGKIWDNISRLVPGTTPLQCAQRWEELLSSNSVVAGDLTGLTATGRPISASRPRKPAKRSHSIVEHQTSTPTSPAKSEIKISTGSVLDIARPRSVMAGRTSKHKEEGVWRSASNEDKVWHHMSQQFQEEQVKSYRGNLVRNLHGKQEEESSGGTFAANFCQSFLKKEDLQQQQRSGGGEGTDGGSDEIKKEDQIRGKSLKQSTSSSSGALQPSSGALRPSSGALKLSFGALRPSSGALKLSSSPQEPVASNNPNMIIHVSDDTKKMEKDFVCSRDILVREMCYFAEHLSSEAPQPWDEVDISVHCDIPVFEWLMQYAKQGMLSGPCGEPLTEPLPAPQLEVENIVSILISSEFLRMDGLVEECLVYCRDHLSAVLASPCNMGCINDKLVTRLANKLTPLEVEETVDKKDKLKSKLFLYHLEQLFKPTSHQPNAASLYRCKHCKRLLTSEQENLFPCTTQRLSINVSGKVVYNHEVSPSWSINAYVQSLQQTHGLTTRDLYWRMWSLVNVLKCEQCHASFQCCELTRCPYHPQQALCSTKNGPAYSCCSQPAAQFSLIPEIQNGCCYRKHSVTTNNSQQSEQVYSTLLRLPESMYTPEPPHHHHHNHHISTTDRQSSTNREPEARLPENHTVMLSLLQMEHAKARYCSPPVATQDSSTCSIGTTHIEVSTETVPIASSTSSASTVYSARQQSHPVSVVGGAEMEEDDEEEEGVAGRAASHHQYMATAGGRNKKKAAYTRQKLHRPSHAKDWVWNCKKTRRWNQDMQRESDERRQRQLTTQLSKMNTTTNKVKEVAYAGGIFSRLEVQFRAQQVAKAMAIQTAQPRSHGQTRKRF